MAHFAREIRRLGMEFGLWFEPEMVNPDSNLYRSIRIRCRHSGRKPTWDVINSSWTCNRTCGIIS